ncbi:MAG: hypothetical protein U0165_01310 [Polyangiaceae bacterium]
MMGSRIYQRDGIWISFSAKKALQDGAPIVVVKRKLDPAWSFDQLVSFILEGITEGKSDAPSHVDKELAVLGKLPAPLLRVGFDCCDGSDD